jgi:hypothetical protein
MSKSRKRDRVPSRKELREQKKREEKILKQMAKSLKQKEKQNGR